VFVDWQNFAHWSDDEVERLLNLIESGRPTREIARALARSETDLQEQARFLEVQLPEHREIRVLTKTADSSAVSVTIHYASCLPRAME
jgi:hypothetical protein